MKTFDYISRDAKATHSDIKSYMDNCWEINNDASVDVKLLVEEFIQHWIDEDPIDFVDTIANKGSIEMPGYIVELAKAAMQAAAAGAAFDEARFSFDEQVLKPARKKEKEVKPETLIGFPAATSPFAPSEPKS